MRIHSNSSLRLALCSVVLGAMAVVGCSSPGPERLATEQPGATESRPLTAGAEVDAGLPDEETAAAAADEEPLVVGRVFDISSVEHWTLGAETASNNNGLSIRKMLFIRNVGSIQQVVELGLIQISPGSLILPEGAPEGAELPEPGRLDNGELFSETIQIGPRTARYELFDSEEGRFVALIDHISDTSEVWIQASGEGIEPDDVVRLYTSVGIDIASADCFTNIDAPTCSPGTAVRLWIPESELPFIPS